MSSIDGYRKKIGEFVWYVINSQGYTIPHLLKDKQNVRGDDGQLAYENNPIWHSRQNLIKSVASMMKISQSEWGSCRTSADFHNHIDQEIAKLKRKERIVNWNDAARIGIFRSKKQQTVPKPIMEKSYEPIIDIPQEIDDMKKTFVSIMKKRGKKDNTYKFALARALLEYCRDSTDGKLEISYEYFANKFLEYYWNQECKFKIRQNYKETPPRIIKEIRQIVKNTKINDLEKLSKDQKRLLLKNISTGIFGNTKSKTSLVIPKFQKVKEGKYSILKEIFYTCDDNKKILRLKPDAFSFFKNNHNILIGTVILEWTKFLEKINGSLPKLVSKVENMENVRGNLAEYKKLYSPHTDYCFYCCNVLKDDYTHVDHFLPWSYIFEDSAWNLVLACRDCNLKKSDSLAKGYTQYLIERNHKYRKKISKLDTSIREIDTKRGWEKEIENHYYICQDYGFAEIRLP